MAATNKADQDRIDLENIIALLVEVDDHLRVALMKSVQWARTDYEASIIQEMMEARKKAREAHKKLMDFHPNKREDFDDKR